MDTPAALSLHVPLPLPSRGAASRVRLGVGELVLEHARFALTLLWSDGREARRYVLGLPREGQLAIDLRVPRFPIQVVPREMLSLAPGGRVRGYVVVPLVPTIVWRSGASHPSTLVELLPPQLRSLWDEGCGPVHRCGSPWMTRFPFQSGETNAVVPVRFTNPTPSAVSPGHLLVKLHDECLRPLRRGIVAAPRRLSWQNGVFADGVMAPQTLENPR